LGQAEGPKLAHHADMEQAQADPSVVQQLMFNRILSFVKLLSVEGVTVVGADARGGTLTCSLAGVNFLVSVILRDPEATRPKHA
jgi:hypothetical protein